MRLTVARSGLIAAAIVAGTLQPGAQQRAQEPPLAASVHTETLRPDILGTHGIVAAGRHYSVSAGVRILQQGGNAIDAGVASVLAASVCAI
jgi:gamma-glutamyltranspeptidase/glutathione hydrolase